MAYAFHIRASTSRKSNQICQECLIEARLRGEKCAPKGAHLPCEQHGDPELWEENVEAWSLYQMVQRQVLILKQYDKKGNPKASILELNFAAVLPTLQLYVSKQRQRDCFDKLLLIHEIMQSKGVADFFLKRGL